MCANSSLSEKEQLIATLRQLDADIATLEKQTYVCSQICHPFCLIARSIFSGKKSAYHTLLDKIHRYNELKDAGQVLLGHFATVERTTVKKMYEKYGLDLQD